ncbi:MAG TPA: hypothetical protein VID30_19865 [Bradyrhizobium sp.]|jgi:hypothetical protein
MTDEAGKSERQQPREKDSRQDRLKLALRENLKRRKTQARERGKMSESSSTDDGTCLDGQVGRRDD